MTLTGLNCVPQEIHQATYYLYGTSYSYLPHEDYVGLNSSLSELVERIERISYTAISAFIESRSHIECGLVNHALCGDSRDVTRKFCAISSSTRIEAVFLGLSKAC